MHHHAMGPGHDRLANRRRMAVALAINVSMLGAGVAGAIVFDSIALLADAGHILADVGAIALGLGAATVARRPAGGRRTFGSGRTEILAALANGIALVIVAVLVMVEAASRLSDPPEVEGLGVLLLGAFGLAGNLAATAVLAKGDREDVNLEGVLRHSAADALGSLGVILSGALVLMAGANEADAVVGLLIGLLILAGSWRLVREPFDVLMEFAPRGIDVREIGEAMAAMRGVREVHDLHVWTVTSGFQALAAHVVIEPGEDAETVRARLEALVVQRFGIRHTTLQTMSTQLLELEDRRGG